MLMTTVEAQQQKSIFYGSSLTKQSECILLPGKCICYIYLIFARTLDYVTCDVQRKGSNTTMMLRRRRSSSSSVNSIMISFFFHDLGSPVVIIFSSLILFTVLIMTCSSPAAGCERGLNSHHFCWCCCFSVLSPSKAEVTGRGKHQR